MNVYDRLFAFGRKQVGDNWAFDATAIRGELAKGYEISPDHLKITITAAPRRDLARRLAGHRRGHQVVARSRRARPSRWRRRRCPPARSPAPTSSASSIAHTIEMTLPKPDRLALANLCVPYAIMINSKLAKQHATADDPWALDWLKTNTAASGAYIVESYQARRKRHPAPQRGLEGRRRRQAAVSSSASSCRPCRSPRPAPT